MNFLVDLTVVVVFVASLCVIVLIGVLLNAGRAPREHSYRLKDGRTVVCLVGRQPFAGPLACDWQHARRVTP